MNLKIVIKPLIFGCVFSTIISFFVINIISKIDENFNPIIMFFSNTIFFTFIFIAANLSIKHIKKKPLEKNNLFELDNIGLALQLISILLAFALIHPSSHSSFMLLGIMITLVCIGIILLREERSEIAISCILWGITILIFTYLVPTYKSYISVLYWELWATGGF